ncbi:MAG TPA: hypothetical protein VH475_25970 [Tepidisphaeraceae bacterium]|jgi:hypothetical protein
MRPFAAARLPGLFAVIALSLIAPFTLAQQAAAAKANEPIPATSAVLIVEPPAGSPAATSDALLQRRIYTHVATIASEQHLRHLFANPQSEIRKTQWFQTNADPRERAAWLRDHLHVTAVPNTSLIALSLMDVQDAKERQVILTEICNAYLNGERTLRTDAMMDRTQMLNTVRIKVEARLKDLRNEMHERQVKMNVDGGGVGRMSVKELELSKLVSEQIEALLAAGKARALHEAAKAAVDHGQDPLGTQELMQRISPFLRNDQEQLQQVETELPLLAAKVGTEHAQYKEVAKRRDVLQERYQKRSEEARVKAREMILEQMQQDAGIAQARADSLNKRVENLKMDLGELSNSLLVLSHLQEEDKALTEQLRNLRRQIESIVAEQSSTALTDIHWHLMPEALPLP